MLLDETFFQSN